MPRIKVLICGVDEAGRGPLAGPVCAAAVILDPRKPIEGLRDSKKLTAIQRERLAVDIRRRAIGWALGWSEVEEIDRINILQASMIAMQRAVQGLSHQPQLARVDGNRAPALDCKVETIIGGDDLDPAISAASILAKTARDELMCNLHLGIPHFRFDMHKGYGTAMHLSLLAEHGPTDHHRRSFAPVRALLPTLC